MADPFEMSRLMRLYEEERAEKQLFLKKEIQEKGYDPLEFAQFLEYKKDNGISIDNWTFSELEKVVKEFKKNVGEPLQVNVQQYQENQDYQQEEFEGDHQISSAEKQSEEQKEHHNKVVENKNNQQKQQQSQLDEEYELIAHSNQYIGQDPNFASGREYVQTRVISPTKLNNTKIDVKVCDGLVKEGGIFSSNYITYQISTQPVGWEVRRKDGDFYYLRKDLIKQFPHIIIPPLPIKSSKQTAKFIKKQERYYSRFLQAIMRSEELKASLFLIDFLSVSDVKQFQKIVKEQDKVKYGKQLQDLITSSGMARVQVTQASGRFSTKIFDYVDSYQILYKEIIDCSKEIHDKSQDLAATFFALQKFIEQLGELNRLIKCQSQYELFAWLSKMVTGSGNFMIQQGELIYKSIGQHLKYHLDEQESFRELCTTRESLKNQYLKQQRYLIDKKERLFKKQDFSKWGGFSSENQHLQEKLKEELLKNKDKAFFYMLPKETQELEQKREELAFYTNQCWDEVKRIGNDDGKLLRDHFKDMAAQQCNYINMSHVMWADFLSHFSEVYVSEEQSKLFPSYNFQTSIRKQKQEEYQKAQTEAAQEKIKTQDNSQSQQQIIETEQKHPQNEHQSTQEFNVIEEENHHKETHLEEKSNQILHQEEQRDGGSGGSVVGGEVEKEEQV